MRLAVHGRKCRDITERADRPATHLGAVSLTAILQHFDAAPVRFHDNFVDVGRLSRCMHHYNRRRIGRDAFEKLGATSDGLRRLGTMISQSMQYGTPLSQALRSIATELRRESITKLEERAHKLGAKLTIPMVLFLLPAMFVILGGSPFLHLVRAFSNLSK